MAAAKLWFLRILGRQLNPDAIQQLHIALLGILLQRIDESPRHGSSSFSSDRSILPAKRKKKKRSVKCFEPGRNHSDLRCLGIFAARPHNHIRRRSLGLSRLLVRVIARRSLLEKAHGRIGDTAHIATSVSRNDAE